MTIPVDRYDLQRCLMLLDATLPALDAAAEREKRRETGKSLRQITDQERAKAVRELLAEMETRYGPELNP